jgi:hypothetical protein
MGLLDDAIREHLELKRRAGADAGDVARQEQEALGRGRAPKPPGLGAGGPEPGYPPPGVAAPSGPEFYVDDEDYEDEEYEEYEDPAGPVEDAGHPVPPRFAEEPAYAEEPRFAPPPPQAPPARPAQPPAPPPPPVRAAEPPPPTPPLPSPGPATEEYRLPPAGSEPDDVLEQTPDFLQETPEHDRLWFEQAPPQEFDFDK